MFSFNTLAKSPHSSTGSADAAQSHTTSMQQRLDKDSFTTGWQNLSPGERDNIIKVLAFAMKDAKRNGNGDGDAARAAAHFLMGKSHSFPGSGNLQVFPPSPRAQKLMDSVLKSGSREKLDKTEDKLDTLLGNLLARMPARQPQWHAFLFDMHSDSALHIDLAKLNLSDATKMAIHQFKTKQLIPPRREIARTYMSEGVHRKDEVQFHCELYAAAFKGERLPFAANAEFFPRYVLDMLKTRPDKFRFTHRLHEPASLAWMPHDGFKQIIEDAFVHLDESTPMRAELREALLCLDRQDETRTLDLYPKEKPAEMMDITGEMRSACKDVSVAMRDLAFGNGRSDFKVELQQQLISRMKGKPGKHWNDELLIDLLVRPPYLDNAAGPSAGKLQAAAEDAAPAIRFKTALIHRIEDRILATPDRRNSLMPVRRVVQYYLLMLREGSAEQRREASMLEPTLYRFLQKNLIRDPDDLQALAGHLRSGDMSLRGARPVIEQHGVEFLLSFCSFQRIPMLSLLSKNENLGALTAAQLDDILLQRELLIPASLLEMEKELGEQAKAEIRDHLLSPACAALLQPQVMQPVADRIKQIFADIYGRELPDAMCRQLMPQLLALRGAQNIHEPIAALLNQAADNIYRPHRINQLDQLTPASLEKLLGDHIAGLAPGAPYHAPSAARSLMVSAFLSRASAAGQSAVEAFVKEALSRSALNAIELRLASGGIKDGVNAALKGAISRNPALAQLQDEQFLSSAARTIMASDDEEKKASGLERAMIDSGELQFFYPMERKDKKALAQDLAKLDGKAIMAREVMRWLTRLWPLLAHADAGEMRKAADKILEYKEWSKLVSDKATGQNHFDEEIEMFEQRLRSLPDRVDEGDGGVAQSPDIWGPFIDRTLPFRNPGNVRRLIAEKNAHIPPDVASKLAFASKYFEDIYADPDDPDETPLKAFVIGNSTGHRLLMVDELHFLNAHNVRGKEKQHFSLRAPAPQQPDQWIEEPIEPTDVEAMDVPSYVRRAIIANHPSVSAFESAIFQAFDATVGESGLQISERSKDSLRLCFQKMATDFREPLPPVALNKSELRELTGDVQLEVEFTELRNLLLQNDLPTAATSPLQLAAAIRNPTLNLPARLISGMEKNAKLSPIAQALETQVDTLSRLYSDRAAKHEIYFVLGLMFLRLSSTDGLGFHVGNENQSFVRFQLMGNYCLANCIAQSDQLTGAQGGLSSQEKAHILNYLEMASTTGTCTGIISNSLGRCAPDHMTPLIDRVLSLLRFASSGE